MTQDSTKDSKLCPTSRAEVNSWQHGAHSNNANITEQQNHARIAADGGIEYPAGAAKQSVITQDAKRALDSGRSQLFIPSLISKSLLKLPDSSPEVGKKFDGGKAPVFQGFEAYFPLAILAVANISKYGKEKYSAEYSDKNWKRVENAAGRYADGESRHKLLSQTAEGLYDSESHLLHAAHKAWNAMATLQLLLDAGTPERDPAFVAPERDPNAI